MKTICNLILVLYLIKGQKTVHGERNCNKTVVDYQTFV